MGFRLFQHLFRASAENDRNARERLFAGFYEEPERFRPDGDDHIWFAVAIPADVRITEVFVAKPYPETGPHPASFTRRLSRGLQFVASYTYSSSL